MTSDEAAGAVSGTTRDRHRRDEAIEGRDAGRCLAPAEHLGTMHVPCGEIGSRPALRVFVFDAHEASRRRGERGVNPEPGLDAGVRVGGQDILPRTQRDASALAAHATPTTLALAPPPPGDA